MLVYRLAPRKHAGDLSGTGAALHGGRWNKKGTPILYTGESREIALLETIVNTPPMIIPELDLLTLALPDDSITAFELDQLPPNWSDYPAPSILAEMAASWVRNGNAIALKVPSCIIHTAYNYLLNCRHPNYHQVKIVERKAFKFDVRLRK